MPYVNKVRKNGAEYDIHDTRMPNVMARDAGKVLAVSTSGGLEFVDTEGCSFCQGYYYAGVFWKESAHLNRLPNKPNLIYQDIDSQASFMYYEKTQSYERLVPLASDQVAGVMKLYSSLGSATDGAMNQDVVSSELRKKVELDTQHLQTDERLDIKTNE